MGMKDRNDPPRYYHVDFYEPGQLELTPANAVHNDIVSSFHELCFLAQGRIFIIREPATASEYLDNLKDQAA
jgi:hypothetical protein